MGNNDFSKYCGRDLEMLCHWYEIFLKASNHFSPKGFSHLPYPVRVALNRKWLVIHMIKSWKVGWHDVALSFPDVPSRSGSMHPQGQLQYGAYGSNTASFYPQDYLYQGNMPSNPYNSMDVMDRTAQLLEDMHLGRGVTSMDPYDYKRSGGTSLYDLKRAEYIRRNQQQRSYFDPAHYTPRNRFRGWVPVSNLEQI